VLTLLHDFDVFLNAMILRSNRQTIGHEERPHHTHTDSYGIQWAYNKPQIINQLNTGWGIIHS